MGLGVSGSPLSRFSGKTRAVVEDVVTKVIRGQPLDQNSVKRLGSLGNAYYSLLMEDT